MTTEIKPYFELAEIVAAFDHPNIEPTERAFGYLLQVANELGGLPGFFRCFDLMEAAERLVRENECLAPDIPATISKQELQFVAKRMAAPGGGESC